MRSSSLRHLRFEALECRRVLAPMVEGGELLINDQVRGTQQSETDADAVAVLADGSFVTAYAGRGLEDDEGIYLRRFDENAAATQSAELVNTTINGRQFGPSIAAFEDGSLVVAWSGRGLGDRHGIFAQWFDSEGNKVGTETLVNTTVGGRQWAPQVATTADGRTIITWDGVGDGDFDGIFVRVFDADRNPVVNEILVNATTTDTQQNAAIASEPGGGFLISWSSFRQDGSDWGIFARRFNADGTAAIDEVSIAQSTTGSQTQPSVTRLLGGDYIIAWQERTATDVPRIMARRLGSDGQPNSNEFQIDEGVAEQVAQVSIAAAPNGGFLAVWMSRSADGSGYEIEGREFDNNNDPLDTQFMVNMTTGGVNSGHQIHPSVAVGGTQAVVLWSGRGAGDVAGVFGQRFVLDPTGAPNFAPIIEEIGNQQARRAVLLEVTVRATDPNIGDVLDYDLIVAPEDATIDRLDNNTAVIRWTPGNDDVTDPDNPIPHIFRVQVTDNGQPEMSSTEEFTVVVDAIAGTL